MNSTSRSPAADSDTTVSEVDVVAKRDYAKLPGAVVGDIKPEIMLGAADIRAYGVASVTELLSELAPEIRSDRGRGGEAPVVLLNGRRVSGFSEVQNIPTEAIQRVDILPEEVALKYGYAANQRVVNIVLRRRFRAATPEAQVGGPTEGGEVTAGTEVDMFRVRRDDRLNLDLKYDYASGIADAARGVAEPAPAVPFDVLGNVASIIPGGQIDPTLSALAGKPVTVAGIPAGLGARAPALGDFATTAGAPNLTSVAADRSLVAKTHTLTANAVLAHPLAWGVNATVNATLGFNSSDSLRGLPGLSLDVPAGDPFSPFSAPVAVDKYLDRPTHQYVSGWTAHLGTAFNKDAKQWRLSLTSAFDHADSQTDTDSGLNAAPLQTLLNAGAVTFNPFAPLNGAQIANFRQATSRSISDSANLQFLANGPLFKLPAGDFYVSARGGDAQTWFGSTSTRGAQFQSVYLTRNDLTGQVNLDLPVASRKHHFLPLLGELSLNANASVDEVSRFGTLKAFGYGANWTPIAGYTLIFSHTNDQAAPTVQQLGNPVIYTPGVAVFDYLTGQAADVTQISGGNRGLLRDNRNVTKIGLTIKPLDKQDLTLTANYIRSDIDHPVETFPSASAAIQAAFPNLFLRDAAGDLIEEDLRTVNFTRSERSELRWGFNYSRPIGKQPPPRRVPDFEAMRRAREAQQAAGGGCLPMGRE